MNRRLGSTNLGRGQHPNPATGGRGSMYVGREDRHIHRKCIFTSEDRHIQRKQKNTISIDIYLGNWSVKIDMYNGKVIRWDNIHL